MRSGCQSQPDTLAASHRLPSEVIRFAIVGAASAALNTVIIVALTELLRIHYLIAYGLCFVMVTGFGFIANRRWSFRIGGRTRPRDYARYVLVATIGTMIGMAIIWVSVRHGCPYPIATFLSAGLIAPLNFVAHRMFSFGKRWHPQ